MTNPCFQTIITNHNGQPSAGGIGVSTTGGTSNVKSSYEEVFDAALITKDCYAMEIWISNIAAASVAEDCVLDIGIDEADSGSFTTKIANLLCACANPTVGSNLEGAAGIHFFFPIHIKRGTQIGARSSVNSATGRNPVVYIKLYADPLFPEKVRSGTHVDTFGAIEASSSGAPVVPGQANKGSWVDLAGADITETYWYWDLGIGINDAVMSVQVHFADLGIGDANHKQVIIRDRLYITGDSEVATKLPAFDGYYETSPNGVRPFGRMQCGGVPESNFSMCAYGVRGSVSAVLQVPRPRRFLGEF